MTQNAKELSDAQREVEDIMKTLQSRVDHEIATARNEIDKIFDDLVSGSLSAGLASIRAPSLPGTIWSDAPNKPMYHGEEVYKYAGHSFRMRSWGASNDLCFVVQLPNGREAVGRSKRATAAEALTML